MSSQPPAPAPPPTFDALPLSAEVRRALDELGYVHPTPVQRAVFEPASRAVDLVVQARTGTGKTAAFGLPLVDALIRRNAANVQALILCPTRELALQVTRELEALGKYRNVRVAAVYGGAPMPRQVQLIREGAQVLVGTPGRVLDHLERRTLDPSTIRVLVIDESDEMLSMGFLPQITAIMSHLPAARQTLLFSATLPPDIQRVAETRLKAPEFITLSGDQVGALEIQHFVYICPTDKQRALLRVIETEDPESAIVFCNTRDETKRVAQLLQQQGFSADWLNADLAQNDREKVMAATRSGNLRFLVCTDVAARGIDISHLTHVINHDFPESAEAYVHRTGRTGRAGRTGTAISLVAPSDVGKLYILRLTYKIKPIEKQLPSARELKTRAEADLVQLFADVFANRTVHPDDLALARRLLTREQADVIVAGLLRDHLGARPEAADEATAARRSRSAKPAAVPTPVAKDASPKPHAETAAVEAAREPAAAPAASREQAAPTRPRPADAPSLRDAPSPRPTALRDSPSPRPAAGPVAASSAADETASPRGAERFPQQAVGTTTEGFVAAPDEARARRRRPRRERSERDDVPSYTIEGDEPRPPDEPRAEVYVNVGERDGATETALRALLEERAGLALDSEDYVHVRTRHSFVGVRRELLHRVVDALNGATIAGKQAMAEVARPRP